MGFENSLAPTLPHEDDDAEQTPLIDVHAHTKMLKEHLSKHKIYHTQPAQGIYLTTRILLLPPQYVWWHLRNLLPAWRPIPTWPLQRAVGCRLIRWASKTFFTGNALPRPDPTQPLSKEEMKQLKEHGGRMVWIEPVRMEDVGEPIRGIAKRAGVSSARVRAFWMGEEVEEKGFGNGRQKDVADGAAVQQDGIGAAGKGKVMLFLHGGSYITGSGHPSQLTSFLALQAPTHSLTLRTTLSLDYRISSTDPNPRTNPFPAALLDAISAFRYLLSLGLSPSQIVIAGDSAGGNLVLALARYLIEVDHIPGQQLGGLVLLSPWSDFTDSHHSPTCSLIRNYNTDYILGLEAGMGSYAVHAYCGGTSPWSPWISPAARAPRSGTGESDPARSAAPAAGEWEDASFRDWPRTIVVAGEREMIVDEIRTLRKKMERDGVPLVYREWDGCPHDFLSMWFMEPERTEALRFVCRWIDGVDQE